MANRDRLNLGYGGWVRYSRDSAPNVEVHMRFEDRAGALVPTEEYVNRRDSEPLRAADMQGIPRRRIAAWVNAEGDALRRLMELPGPDLRRAASSMNTNPHDRTWVGLMLAAQIDGSGVPQQEYPRRGRPRAPRPRQVHPRSDDREPGPEPDASLEVPSSRPYSDDFYRSLLKVRDRLAVAGVSAPARTIAETNQISYSKVRDWIRTAESIRKTGRKR